MRLAGRAAEPGAPRDNLLLTRKLAQIAPPAPPVGGVLPAGYPDAVLVAGPGIRRLIGGEVTPAEAVAQDLVAVVRGEERILRAFAQTFHILPIPEILSTRPTAQPA